MPSGGYHPPANPAQVSGPGALSQRTDSPQPAMQLPNAKYGEQANFQAIQQGAPMQAPPGPPTPGSGGPVAMPTPISQGSQRPGEPVTAGADAGMGPGSDALQIPQGDTRESLKAQFGPILPALIREAQSSTATQAFKDSVQALLSLF